MLNYRETITDYRERLSRIALFDVFNQASNKTKKDQSGQEIDYYGMMLMTLLFFFECMLTREKDSSTDQLAYYLKQMSQAYYELDDQAYLEIARQMIGILRPVGGKKYQKSFMNFETGQVESIEYNYLKVSGWDKNKNIQFYALDEQGLELVFASKEYYSEFQISISQLILRKQLEKGEFMGALRQIDEMRLSVHSIRDKMLMIKHEVQSNIISDEVYNRYKGLIESINSRLNREHEEFEELTAFVRETHRRYEEDLRHANKEKLAFQTILEVDNALNSVHQLHSKLLEESIELKTKALEAARESMYFIGLNAFNFKQEIVVKTMNTPMPFMEMKVLAKPFMGMKKARIWSPVALFARQSLYKKDGSDQMNGFLDLNDDEKETALIEKRQRVFKWAFEAMKLNDLNRNKRKLSDILLEMSEEDRQIREVYEMILLLHQMSPLDVNKVKAQKRHLFAKAMEGIGQVDYELRVSEQAKEKVQMGQIEFTELYFEWHLKDLNS